VRLRQRHDPVYLPRLLHRDPAQPDVARVAVERLGQISVVVKGARSKGRSRITREKPGANRPASERGRVTTNRLVKRAKQVKAAQNTE
jgi:hypothetical protein